MKRKLILFFKKGRKVFYLMIKRPRIYYNDNDYLKNYNFIIKDLSFYKKNSFTNNDILESIKLKMKL